MKVKRIRLLLFLFLLTTLAPVLIAAFSEAPPQIVAVMIIRLCPFEKEINQGGKGVTIYVLGDAKTEAALKAMVGKPMGRAKLESVTSGKKLPAKPPDILFIGKTGLVEEAIAYCRENKVISVTGNPGYKDSGISLVIGIESAKPMVFLNMSASDSEGKSWNPAIFKLVKRN